MRLRPILIKDIEILREIHEKYYSELEMIDFTKVLGSFIIEDNDEIVMAGAIKPLAESLLLTDKSLSRITVGRALVEAQMASIHICKQFRIEDLCAYVTDENYAKHLIKHGFHKRDDISLRMRIP